MLPLEMVYAFDPVPPPPYENHEDEEAHFNHDTGDLSASDRYPTTPFALHSEKETC